MGHHCLLVRNRPYVLRTGPDKGKTIYRDYLAMFSGHTSAVKFSKRQNIGTGAIMTGMTVDLIYKTVCRVGWGRALQCC